MRRFRGEKIVQMRMYYNEAEARAAAAAAGRASGRPMSLAGVGFHPTGSRLSSHM
jgi:hypothetical protein